MKITNAISLVIGLIGVLWLGIAGWYGAEWYEHRAKGEPSWARNHFLFFTWSPPDSLAAQRDYYKAQVDVLMVNQAKLMAQIQSQNASIDSLNKAGQKALGRSQGAIQSNEHKRVAAATAAVDIQSRTLPDNATCPALKPTDDAFVAFLRTQQ